MSGPRTSRANPRWSPERSTRTRTTTSLGAGAYLLASSALGCGSSAVGLDRSSDWLAAPAEGGVAAHVEAARQSAPRVEDEPFRNTYYDFPSDDEAPRDTGVFDARCKPIALVSRAFHDRVCLQGSGRLADGATISFARRDCECAEVCPRSGQRICFERLDPAQFPTGRGAMGKPVTPLRSVAVDVAIVPLGTALYIREFDGLPLEGGEVHDGCFVAEDRGSKVVGRHIDVFTGDPATTRVWNQRVPSNSGVHVEIDSLRCSRRRNTPSTPP
jgi:3D (Asp-Asp-Asp) domain-containing protein